MSDNESTQNIIKQRKAELAAIINREKEIPKQLYELQEQRENLDKQYRELFCELKNLPQNKHAAERALAEAQDSLNKEP